MLYLIYASKDVAIERADEEGKKIGYSYWVNGIGTRRINSPAETIDNTWALDVTKYDLSDEEEASTVDHYTPIPDPEED